MGIKLRISAVCFLAVVVMCSCGNRSVTLLDEGESQASRQTADAAPGTYAYCSAGYPSSTPGAKPVTLGSGELSLYSKECTVGNVAGRQSVMTGETGYSEWAFELPCPGLYRIVLQYYPLEGKGADIERALQIDGEYPFEEAKRLVFKRVWVNDAVVTDSKGNDIYCGQSENPQWQEALLGDSAGYINAPFVFYFEQGAHALRLEAISEPTAISGIKLIPVAEPPTYEEARSRYGAERITGFRLKLQAEEMTTKSSAALRPAADRSSPLSEPYEGAALQYNIIGAGKWKKVGDSVEYDFEVPQDGIYHIALKARQSTSRELTAFREVAIDGVVPFREASVLSFPYSSQWYTRYLGGEEPYDLWLTQGQHTLRMTAVLSDVGEYCRELRDSLDVLNGAYRKLIMVFGTNPDINFDYNLEVRMPELFDTFRWEHDRLAQLSGTMQQKMGSSIFTSSIDTQVRQLEKFLDKPYEIPEEIYNFSNNLSSIGSIMIEMQNTDLSLDYLEILSPDQVPQRPAPTFWESAAHEARMFFASFEEDYNAIGDTAESDRVIDVWISTAPSTAGGTSQGLDQAQLIKQLAAAHFTAQTGIGVQVKLIREQPKSNEGGTGAALGDSGQIQGSLMQAVMSGMGPDVAISVAQTEPVDYALRGAVKDLSGFEGFEEVAGRFHPASLTPFQYQGGVYGIPETVEFPMLFYREDILREIGVQVPKTWDELFGILPILQRNNLQFGISPSVDSFAIFLMQSGGSLYSADSKESLLDSEQSIEAMKRLTEMYTKYGLPRAYDFANRFRTGEMPLAMAGYTTSNLLAAFAPEIRSQWGFTTIPGTMQPDGTVDYRSCATMKSGMILDNTDQPEASWEFLRWWTSEETQSLYGREIENILSAAGRYPAANMAALKQLPWPASDYASLQAQYEHLFAIPVVPGSYYTSRYINNAFREISYNYTDTREVMTDYDRIVDREMADKRRKLGLE